MQRQNADEPTEYSCSVTDEMKAITIKTNDNEEARNLYFSSVLSLKKFQ